MDKTILRSFSNLSFLKVLREGLKEGVEEADGGEGKFGLVPPSVDPNIALIQLTPSHGPQESLLKEHPLLSKSSQFSGTDQRLTPNPTSNKEAQEKYPQLRREPRNILVARRRKEAPRLVRS